MKPGATTRPFDVDDARRRLGDRRRDADDRVALDGDIAAIPRAAGAVDDAPAAEDEVVGRRLSREREPAGATGQE